MLVSVLKLKAARNLIHAYLSSFMIAGLEASQGTRKISMTVAM